MGFFRSFFAKEPSSAQLAKQRLQVVLVQDHLSMAPGTMEAIKTEIMEVISRHLDIDPDGVEVAVERRGHNDELVANIPVRRNYGRTRDGAPIPLDRPKPPPATKPRPSLMGGGRSAGRRRR
jgi:cell division topological specificity factor